VVGRADDGAALALVAYVVPANADDVDLERLRADLRERLPEQMIPSGFVVVDDIPHTPSGKRDRRRLPRLAPQIAGIPSYEQPTGAIECLVSQIWKDLLGLEVVGRRDNFFDLGGHSLLMFRLQGRLAQTLGVRLGITELFYHPTIQALAAYCAQHLEPAAAPASGQTT
jgi:aryl carrier-like protein